MSLAHNHVTNLFISNYRRATVTRFGQLKQLHDKKFIGHFSTGGIVMPLPFDVAFVNIYICSYREATENTFHHPLKHLGCHCLLVSDTF